MAQKIGGRGSKLASEFRKSCPEHIIKKREKYSEKIDKNFVLLEDLLFNSPSGATAFVCGSSTNGNIEWKTAKGITLKELDANIEEQKEQHRKLCCFSFDNTCLGISQNHHPRLTTF